MLAILLNKLYTKKRDLKSFRGVIFNKINDSEEASLLDINIEKFNFCKNECPQMKFNLGNYTFQKSRKEQNKLAYIIHGNPFK